MKEIICSVSHSTFSVQVILSKCLKGSPQNFHPRLSKHKVAQREQDYEYNLSVCLCMCVSLLRAQKHAINRQRLQVLASLSVTSLLHQHFLPPHGTNIPLVGLWHADVAWSSHVPVNKSTKFQQTVSFHVYFGICTHVRQHVRGEF